MQYRKIGNVILDYTYYKGIDLYTDGNIEDEILDIVKEGKQNEILISSDKWPILYHLSDFRENLLEWYPFHNDAKILEIGAGCGAITGLLSRKASEVISIELSERRSLINAYKNMDCENVKIIVGNFQDIEINEQFDYITLIGVWEYANAYVNDTQPHLKMLEIAKKYLKQDGRIIIAIENKMGLKYWNGAPEDHTGNLYSGLNDYRDTRDVRTFSKQEIEKILKKSKIKNYSFYYPMPDYKLPEIIYSDSILPKPGMERNFGKDYAMCRFYNFNDAIVSDQICGDNMFTYFANSFLIITGDDDNKKCFIKYNKMRKDKYKIKTEILEENGKKIIEKSALKSESNKHIFKLKENEKNWKKYFPKIRCVEGILDKNHYITPYIDGTDLETLFYQYRNDHNLFIDKIIYYLENYLTPLENKLIPFCVSDEFISVFGNKYPSNKTSLKCTNVDMIFSNIRISKDNQLYCFDYEWVFDFLIPYEFVVWRSIKFLYEKYVMYLRKNISEKEFWKTLGISDENLLIYRNMEINFSNYVAQNAIYLNNYRKTSITQNTTFN